MSISPCLLNDGWDNAYDCGVVVSNDSGRSNATRRRNCGKRITPGKGRQLLAHADFSRHVRVSGATFTSFPTCGTNIGLVVDQDVGF